MAESITMPKLGFDMAEGTLIAWIKNVGDAITSGDVVAEIETDKATVEVESYVSGTILALLAEPGDVLAVGSVIGWVGEQGEEISENGQSGAAAEPTNRQQEETVSQTEGAAAPVSSAATVRTKEDDQLPGGVKASPLARKIAEDQGIDLRRVHGSGPNGRIVKADLEHAPVAAAAPQPSMSMSVSPPPEGPDIEVIDMSKLRERIGARMVESKQQTPHFYVTTEIDVEALLALRKQLNENLAEETQKISVNDLIVKAAALTLREFPNLNTHYYGDKLARHKRINIGIAVALPNGGLMNVVVQDADKVALGSMAAQNKAMIARAREGKIKPADVEGSTFTVSNLGIYDVDHFIAIINPPEAAILAVGSARRIPVVQDDGALGVGTRMKITISVDHRVSDGAEAAEYMARLKDLLENPMRLLL